MKRKQNTGNKLPKYMNYNKILVNNKKANNGLLDAILIYQITNVRKKKLKVLVKDNLLPEKD